MKTEDLEIELLLEGIFRKYGYDFRNYAKSSLRRRLEHRMQMERVRHISELLPKVLHDEVVFDRLLLDMSVTVTEMFRDPLFFKALREQMIPLLKTYSFVKIWVAGCATGEEAYSLAILLEEEDFYQRTQIYATDFNNQSLELATAGVYSAAKLQDMETNYQKAGGKRNFSDYYKTTHGSIKIDDALKNNIMFSHHNLVHDKTFGEMNLIMCRNVLIYFDQTLQNQVLELFKSSLCNFGFLGLGAREVLEFSSVNKDFKALNREQRVYQKNSL